MSLFDERQFAQTCTKCGHAQELHTKRGCSGTTGALECKCYRFSDHNPRPDLFNDRRDEQ